MLFQRAVVAIDDHDTRRIRSILGKESDSSDSENEEETSSSVNEMDLQDEEVCFDQTTASHVIKCDSLDLNQLEPTTSNLMNDESFNEWLKEDLEKKKKFSQRYNTMLVSSFLTR